MCTTGSVHRVPAGAPGRQLVRPSPGGARRTDGAHERSGSAVRCTTVPGRRVTPVDGSSASAPKTSSDVAAQRSTASAGAAR